MKVRILEVLDFYSKEKLSINKVANILVNTATMYIVARTEKGIREFLITIPKKYIYSHQDISYVIPKKREEYFLLKDFLLSSKNMVMEKCKIDNKMWKDIIKALDVCVIKHFSTLNTFMKYFELFKKVVIGR